MKSPEPHLVTEEEIDYFVKEFPELTREEIIDVLEIYIMHNNEAS
jgi:uncharacterized protein (DUF433 family)